MILVAGATGIVGTMIVNGLLDQGKRVRILVRAGSDYAQMERAGAEPVLGDLRDRPSLDRAMQGVETVVTTANSALRGGGDNVETVERDGNRNLIDSAREAGVKHFIFTSALGVSVDSPVPFMAEKARAEEYLRSSGMPYTILAPNVFTEIWVGNVAGAAAAGRPVVLVGEGRRRHAFVSARDVASFAVAAVDNPAAYDRYVVVAGPESISFSEIIERVERRLGRAVTVQRFAIGEPIPGLPDLIRQFLTAFETYDSTFDMSDNCRDFGVRLTSVDDFLAEALPDGPALPVVPEPA
jgi:uncharacterized protein YbjT (DUF2867 family)